MYLRSGAIVELSGLTVAEAVARLAEAGITQADVLCSIHAPRSIADQIVAAHDMGAKKE